MKRPKSVLPCLLAVAGGFRRILLAIADLVWPLAGTCWNVSEGIFAFKNNYGAVESVFVAKRNAFGVAEFLNAGHAGSERLNVFRLEKRIGDELVRAYGR